METFYIEGLNTCDYYTVVLERKEDKIACQIFTHFKYTPGSISFITYEELLDRFCLVRIKEMTPEAIAKAEASIKFFERNGMYTEAWVSENFLGLLNIIKNVKEPLHSLDRSFSPGYTLYNTLPDSGFVVEKLFNDKHSVEERLDAILNNTPEKIKEVCKKYADTFCEKQGLALNESHWHKVFILEICRFYHRGEFDLTYKQFSKYILDNISGAHLEGCTLNEKPLGISARRIYFFANPSRGIKYGLVIDQGKVKTTCNTYSLDEECSMFPLGFKFENLLECMGNVTKLEMPDAESEHFEFKLNYSDKLYKCTKAIISNHDIYLLDFIDTILDPTSLSDNSAYILEMCACVKDRLFNGCDTVENWLKSINSNAADDTKSVWEWLSDKYCRKNNFKIKGPEWHAYYTIVACQYQHGGHQMHIYSIKLNEQKSVSIKQMLANQLN